jgi:predicted aspartyl protease
MSNGSPGCGERRGRGAGVSGGRTKQAEPRAPLFVFSASLERAGPVIEITVGVPVEREAALRAAGEPVPRPILLPALIDTGSTVTVVRTEVLRGLGLPMASVRSVHTASQRSVLCDAYLVHLTFPEGHSVETEAVGLPLSGQHVDALLGRDVLAGMRLLYLGCFNLFVCAPDGAGRAIPEAFPECEVSLLRREFDLALNRLIEGELLERQRHLQDEAERRARRRSPPRRKRQERPRDA